MRAKVPTLAIGVVAGLLVGGGAFALAQTSRQPDDAGVHGGPKPRFHSASECNLVDVGSLEGNWTHGDYVSAVEKSDPAKVREAARSRCGKPDHGAAAGAKAKSKAAKEKPEPSSEPKQAPPPSPKPSPSAEKPSPSPSPSESESPAPETSSPEPSVEPSASGT